MTDIIKGFQAIVFIFIVIFTMFWLLQVFVELGNLLQTTSFIESMGVTCSDSVSQYQVQALSIPATRVQNLDETNCISHSTNTLGKGMNPIILPPAMDK